VDEASGASGISGASVGVGNLKAWKEGISGKTGLSSTGLTGLGSSSSTVAGFGVTGSLSLIVTLRRSFSFAFAAR